MAFLRFLTYNNLVPIALSFVLLSVSGAMAASPTVRAEVSERVYAEEVAVEGVDNSYLLDTDLDAFEPTVRVAGIIEDDAAYYVTYELGTLGLEAGVWQPVTRTDTLTVPKSFLTGLNLGEHLSRYFDELTRKEKQLLIDTQEIESGLGRSTRQVATRYRGIIGDFFDPDIRALPGYIPPEPEPEPIPAPRNDDDAQDDKQPDDPSGDTPQAPPPTGDAPSVVLVGATPLLLSIGDTYTELGALVDDTEDGPAGVSLGIDGAVDTATAGAYVVTYIATDRDGNTATVIRDIIVAAVEDESAPESPQQEEGQEPVLESPQEEEQEHEEEVSSGGEMEPEPETAEGTETPIE
jgi:hypothetical protein